MKRSIRRRPLTERPRRTLNREMRAASYLAEHTLRSSLKTGTRYTEAL
jgi:hypothetical protein